MNIKETENLKKLAEIFGIKTPVIKNFDYMDKLMEECERIDKLRRSRVVLKNQYEISYIVINK